jgi:LPXTG-site transpeptidase (sortase) family protein
MKLQRVVLGIATVLLIAGLSTQYIQARQTIPYSDAVAKQVIQQNTPIHITIPRINIDATVKPGGIVNGQWILSDTYVHTMVLNKAKNETLLYAHERVGLFVNLNSIQKNDRIALTDKHGKVNTYAVYDIEKVKPTELSKLYGKENSITLYTCNGAFDQYRLVVKAKLIKE